MEAPLGAGSADDGSSLLPPAARAGMTVRIKRKEREREKKKRQQRNDDDGDKNATRVPLKICA